MGRVVLLNMSGYQCKNRRLDVFAFVIFEKKQQIIIVFLGPHSPLKEERFVLMSELVKDLSKLLSG